MLDKLHQPPVVEGVEEPTEVGIEHPVHVLRRDPDRQRIQGLMRAAPRPEPVLQRLPVVLPRLAVDARGRVSLQRVVRGAQGLDVVHVVQERREPLLPVPFGGLTYSLERTERAIPARCPERGLLVRVPLGPLPSLHHLRGRLPGLVRRLPRYYGAVRLPALVHHRRVSLDFPMRSAAPSATDERASRPLSRASTHDSGPAWFATPSPDEAFIHCTAPV
jgi:hypothetical protein